MDAGIGEDFAALLEESLQQNDSLERTVVKGKVVSVDSDYALIDVGLKSEGRVALKEFAPPGQPAEIAVGDQVEVFVERYEDVNGEVVLSREKARREEAWEKLEEASTRPSVSPAPSSAGSRAVSPSIFPAPWRSFRAARSISARCATSRRSWAPRSPS